MKNLKEKVRSIIAKLKKIDIFDEEDKKEAEEDYLDKKRFDNRPSVPDKPTYWTTFVFSGHDPDDLHCTHKYFGEIDNDKKVERIIKVLDEHFEKNPFKKFTPSFNQEEFFGEKKDVRVLRPKKFDPDKFRIGLKDKLDKIQEDKWPEYKPHVTSADLDEMKKPIVSYAFMYGNDAIKIYKEPNDKENSNSKT
jgi:hypothetical protein